jgi:hypothetical protein
VESTDSDDIQRRLVGMVCCDRLTSVGSRNKIGVYCENHMKHKIQCDNMQCLNAVPVGALYVKRVSKTLITQTALNEHIKEL